MYIATIIFSLLSVLASYSGVVDGTFAYRTVTIINQCSVTVRVGRTGGQCLPRDDTRYPSTGCPLQMTLNPANNQCHWDVPSYGNGTDLQPGSNVSYQFSGQDFSCSGNLISWSGAFWASTGCENASACETGICFSGPNSPQNGYCPTYRGPQGPVTLAEFTFANSADTYDISSINGINLPIEMQPTNPTPASQFARSGAQAYYWCGNPGGRTPLNANLAGCNWTYDLGSIYNYGDQTINLTLVAKGDNNSDCTMDSSCPPGEVCGTLQQLDPFDGPGQQLYPGRCGRLIGVWTSNEICTWSSGFNSPNEFPNTDPFRCKTSTGQGSGVFGQLYSCAAPQYNISGYTDPSPGSCDAMTTCGCSDWNSLGINAPATSPCQCNNTVWLQQAFPWLEPIKRACPTSYSYPFDDASSTFQCSNSNTTNTMGYTITFCPENRAVDRLPAQMQVLPGNGGVMVLCGPIIPFTALLSVVFLNSIL